ATPVWNTSDGPRKTAVAKRPCVNVRGSMADSDPGAENVEKGLARDQAPMSLRRADGGRARSARPRARDPRAGTTAWLRARRTPYRAWADRPVRRRARHGIRSVRRRSAAW